MYLFYCRHYVNQYIIASLCHLNQSNVSRLFKRLEQVISQSADPHLNTVLDKLRAQLKREKDKSKDRRKGKLDKQGNPGPLAEPEVPVEEAEAQPLIIQEDMPDMKPMTSEEALIQLEETERNFLVFINADNERVNVLYRKNSGDFGLIDPRM